MPKVMLSFHHLQGRVSRYSRLKKHVHKEAKMQDGLFAD